MDTIRQLIDPAVIPAQILGFILLWIVLGKFLFRPVMALLRAREEEIRSTYQSAETEKIRAEEFRADYEQRLAGIESEARARLQSAIKEAEATKNDILTEARTRSEDILKRGQEELAREREKVMAEMQEQVVNISIAAAGKLIGETLDDKKHRKLVGDFIDGIGAAK